MTTTCYLTVTTSFTDRQCCCNCKLLLKTRSHPATKGDHTGFACGAFLNEGVVLPGWPQHSCGCEVYTPKEKS